MTTMVSAIQGTKATPGSISLLEDAVQETAVKPGVPCSLPAKEGALLALSPLVIYLTVLDNLLAASPGKHGAESRV